MESQLKRLIIKAGYLTKNKKVDPTFFRRVFTDNKIWWRDLDENQRIGLLLTHSEAEYIKLIQQDKNHK
jgi:hypothetical protein